MATDKIGEFDLGGTEDDLDIEIGMAWPSRAGESGGPQSIAERMVTIKEKRRA